MPSRLSSLTTPLHHASPGLHDAERRLTQLLWPPAPGMEWIDESGKRLTTVLVPQSNQRPTWMERFRIDATVSRPALLRWLHDEAQECAFAANVWELLLASTHHFEPAGLRNPRVIAQAVLSVLEERERMR